MFTYRTCGTCSRSISFEVDDENRIHSVSFEGGCRGNTQGVCRLAEGMDICKVRDLLKGVQCRNGTSCPDQLSRAIDEYLSQK